MPTAGNLVSRSPDRFGRLRKPWRQSLHVRLRRLTPAFKVSCTVRGDLTGEARALGQASPERGDETLVALAALGLGGDLAGLRERGGGGDSEADEQRYHLDRDTEIALEPFGRAGLLVEAPGECRRH